MGTISDRIAATGGRASAFDYLRIGLSMGVLAVHTVGMSYGPRAELSLYSFNTMIRPLFTCILPLFFSLSGFLVAGSLDRSKTIGMFLGLRIIRIYPALAVEVLLSAFILGPILTSDSLTAYFSNEEFRTYLLNISGDVHYYLPGVYTTNPYGPRVNAQLWTVPWELACYATITAIVLLGARRYRFIALASLLLLTTSGLAVQIIKHGFDLPDYPQAIGGPFLVLVFLGGVVAYLYRDKIPYNGWLFVVSALLSWAFLWKVKIGAYFLALPISYVLVYVGLHNPRKIWILRGADYSYGIYLYHAVIQQSLMQVFPWARHWYVNLSLSLPLAVSFAALSWHFVEKPALKLRTKLSAFESVYLSHFPNRNSQSLVGRSQRKLTDPRERLAD